METILQYSQTGIAFLIALSVLVFVHELGHYLVARWNRVRIEVFSIGFGPELKGWTDRHGTRWKFSAIPLGGYVKMFGEGEAVAADGEAQGERPMTEAEKAVSFHHKPLGQRAAIVVAGPAANYLFAMLVFAALFVAVGVPGQRAVIGAVEPGAAAAAAGIQTGDIVFAIDGRPIETFIEMRDIVVASPGKGLRFSVRRGDGETLITVTPRPKETTTPTGETRVIGLIGVHLGTEYVRQNPFNALWLAVKRTVFLNVEILRYLRDVVTGVRPADELGGIIRIAYLSGQVAQMGIDRFLTFLAFLSVNLGLINLLPIPVLDGGHLAFYALERVRKRPLGPRAQEYSSWFGLACVLGLVFYVTANDLEYFKFFEFIRRLFT